MTEQELIDQIAKFLHNNYCGISIEDYMEDAEILLGLVDEGRKTNQILSMLEPVELEALGEEEFKTELIKYANEICDSNPIELWNQTEIIKRCMKATIKKNQKGQLFRLEEMENENIRL